MKILPNGIAVIEGDSHISAWVEEEGRLDHDRYSLPIILEHIEEGDVVVDGGAFIGDHTIAYLEKVGASGSVIAFEPNPAAFQCLRHNCPNVLGFNYGLADKASRANLGHCDNAGARSLRGEGEEIKLMRLDELRFDRLDFIKLDVEGCEMSALMGAGDLLGRFRPKMWIEINRVALENQGTSSGEIFRMILGLGYEIQSYPDDKGDQYDVLCMPL